MIKKSLLVGLAGVLCSGGLFAQPTAERLQLCAACHGPNGQSTIAENPKIAGLQARYFAQQLRDFKSGKRKAPAMQAALADVDEKEFDLLATHFSQQKPVTPGQGDPKLLPKGKEIFMEGIVGSAVPACAGCHKDDGTGTNKYPRLAGQHPAYVAQQMLAYKNGSRNNDDRGVMRAVAERMNEAEIRAVAEFIVTMKGDEE